MNTGKKELQSILDELDDLKLQHMAAKVKRQDKMNFLRQIWICDGMGG